MTTKQDEPDAGHMESGFLTPRSGPRLKAQVAALLEAAETAADEVLVIAQAEAEEHLTNARGESARLRAGAEAVLLEARATAERIHGEARAEAEAILKTAVEKGDRERRAAAAQAAETRRQAQRLATMRREQVSGLTEELSLQAQAAEAELEKLRAMLGGAAETLGHAIAEGWTPPDDDAGGAAREDTPSADPHRRTGEPVRKGLFASLRAHREDAEAGTPSTYS